MVNFDWKEKQGYKNINCLKDGEGEELYTEIPLFKIHCMSCQSK